MHYAYTTRNFENKTRHYTRTYKYIHIINSSNGLFIIKYKTRNPFTSTPIYIQISYFLSMMPSQEPYINNYTNPKNNSNRAFRVIIIITSYILDAHETSE